MLPHYSFYPPRQVIRCVDDRSCLQQRDVNGIFRENKMQTNLEIHMRGDANV
jgi:hypothetical protein